MFDLEFGNVYGAPPPELVEVRPGATQYSPLVPGAACLARVPPGSLEGLAMLAPAGTIERRAAIARGLLALRPGALLLALAPKDRGGSRLAGDLEDLGCASEETARRHHRICLARAPGDADAIARAIQAGAPRFLDDIGLWSRPGVFSWDRIDPGSALLLAHLPALAGAGADFGCGIGVLARAVLASPKVSSLALIDIDRRALKLAERNIDDPRVVRRHADARAVADLAGLDFVVMNPPFHAGGAEDRALGQGFIRRAADALRKGGVCWLTANRHLPYEDILKASFRGVTLVASEGGYKIFEARK